MGAVGAGCNFCEGETIDLRGEFMLPITADRHQAQQRGRTTKRYLKDDRQASLELARENPAHFDTFKRRGKSQKSFQKMDLSSLTRKRSGIPSANDRNINLHQCRVPQLPGLPSDKYTAEKSFVEDVDADMVEDVAELRFRRMAPQESN